LAFLSLPLYSSSFSRLILARSTPECIPYIIALVAALSVHDPLLRQKFTNEENAENAESSENSAKPEDKEMDPEAKKLLGTKTLP
jgi:hypothetical protein